MARVLVVNDFGVIHAGLIGDLTKAGYDARDVASTEAACTSLRRSRMDLVILHMQMPGEDGLRFIHMVRAEAALHALPVLIVTPGLTKEVVLKAAKAGVHGIIVEDFALCSRVLLLVQRLVPVE